MWKISNWFTDQKNYVFRWSFNLPFIFWYYVNGGSISDERRINKVSLNKPVAVKEQYRKHGILLDIFINNKSATRQTLWNIFKSFQFCKPRYDYWINADYSSIVKILIFCYFVFQDLKQFQLKNLMRMKIWITERSQNLLWAWWLGHWQ